MLCKNDLIFFFFYLSSAIVITPGSCSVRRGTEFGMNHQYFSTVNGVLCLSLSESCWQYLVVFCGFGIHNGVYVMAFVLLDLLM